MLLELSDLHPSCGVLPTISVLLPAACITQIDWKKPRSNMLDDNQGDREAERGGGVTSSSSSEARNAETDRSEQRVPTQYTMVVPASRLPHFFYLTNALPLSPSLALPVTFNIRLLSYATLSHFLTSSSSSSPRCARGGSSGVFLRTSLKNFR